MKLYTLSILFFFYELNFKALRCQNRETPCLEFKSGTFTQPGTPGCYTTILTFFFIFSLVCRLIHPYRLSNNPV